MTRRKVALWLVLGAGLLFFFPIACSPVYWIAPITARVVDAETGAPIKGAHVIANWQLVTGSLDGERARGQLEVRETVTDDRGEFHIDGFVRMNFSMNHLRDQDPQLIVFKPGYEFQRIWNNRGTTHPVVVGFRRSAQIAGKEIKLARLASSGSSRDPFYWSLQSNLAYLIHGCGWKYIPNAIVAMDAEKARIEGANPGAIADLPSIESVEGTSAKCGSFRAQLKNDAR